MPDQDTVGDDTVQDKTARYGDATDYSDDNATFGDRLTLAREAAGLGQADLAHRIGVSLGRLRNWEDDQSEPRANRLQMLAGMLNVSMGWLMSGQGTGPRAAGPELPAGPAAQACLAELRSLRTEQLNLADQLERLEGRLRVALD